MKKISILLFALLIMLSGCNASTDTTVEDNVDNQGGNSYYILPDLQGMKLTEIEELFKLHNQSYEIIFEPVQDEELEYRFSSYHTFDIGDVVSNNDVVKIGIYPEFTGERTFFYLPDLTGYSELEIQNYFDDLEVRIRLTDSYDYDETKENMFYGYGSLYETGDKFYLTSVLSIIIYRELEDLTSFFFPQDMEYDGPLLSDEFENVDPIDPRGGYFEVELKYCTDGDTGVFEYPTDIYDAITSSAKSTRFLNMDTEETYSGGEEEWGKPASVYTCELLTSAESIILQTDPNDGLTGTYGRLLAWIWVKLPGEDEYHLLNYMVVKQGLAQVKFEFGAGETISYGDYTYNEWMHIAEDYAKANDLGQWGDLLDYYWDYATDSPDYHKWNSN